MRAALRAVLLGGGAAAPLSSAWNPADKSANVTLSNSNRTAAVPSVVSKEGARGTQSRATGSWHFEVTQTTGNQSSWGVSDGAQALNRYPGTDAAYKGVGIIQNGTIFVDGGTSGVSGDSYTTGDTVAVEWNAATGQVWFEKLGGTGRKGPIFTTAATAMFPKVCLERSVVASATVNTGQATFLVAPTSGFSAWG